MGKVKKVRRVQKIRRIKKAKTFTPRTKNEIGSSKIEKIFGLVLSKFGVELEEQFQIGYKYYDFKVKDKNILLEFDGDWFHKNPKTHGDYPANAMQRKNMKNDKIKNTLAEANGYRLIRIWEDDFRNRKHEVIDLVLKFINE